MIKAIRRIYGQWCGVQEARHWVRQTGLYHFPDRSAEYLFERAGNLIRWDVVAWFAYVCAAQEELERLQQEAGE